MYSFTALHWRVHFPQQTHSLFYIFMHETCFDIVITGQQAVRKKFQCKPKYHFCIFDMGSLFNRRAQCKFNDAGPPLGFSILTEKLFNLERALISLRSSLYLASLYAHSSEIPSRDKEPQVSFYKKKNHTGYFSSLWPVAQLRKFPLQAKNPFASGEIQLGNTQTSVPRLTSRIHHHWNLQRYYFSGFRWEKSQGPQFPVMWPFRNELRFTKKAERLAVQWRPSWLLWLVVSDPAWIQGTACDSVLTPTCAMTAGCSALFTRVLPTRVKAAGGQL